MHKQCMYIYQYVVNTVRDVLLTTLVLTQGARTDKFEYNEFESLSICVRDTAPDLSRKQLGLQLLRLACSSNRVFSTVPILLPFAYLPK